MNRIRLFLTSGLILTILLASAVFMPRATAQSEFLVWTATSLDKVKPNDTPGQLKPISIAAARNEYESFQIIVTAGSESLSNVDVAVSNLTSSTGGRISKKNIHIYKVAYINLAEPSNLDGGTGEWPDALVPKVDDYAKEKRNAFPFSVSAGRNQPVWIEIYVPGNVSAGEYRGQVSITAQNQQTKKIEFKLTVWNFTIPATSSLKTAFAVGTPNGLAKGHFGTAEVSPNDKLELMKVYTLAQLKHRVSNDACTYPEPGFDGTQIDWRSFDKNWGPFLDGTVLPNGARLTSIRVAEQNSDLKELFYKLYAEHFKEKGWFDQLFHYTADEPDPSTFQALRERADSIHRGAPDMRVLVTTEVNPVLDGAVNIWVPIINYVENKEGFGRPTENRRDTYFNTISEGNELWWYQACFSHGCGVSITGDASLDSYFTGWPSYMIDTPAIYNRIMEWLTWRYDVSGELYFLSTYAYFDGDPWTNQFYFGGNGDGTLFYPGTPDRIGGRTHIPIESIRLKMIRDGMEDYEYFKLLADKGQKGFVDSQVAAIAPKTYDWSQDPERLLSVRNILGNQLNSLR
jgi:hypothetical protein